MAYSNLKLEMELDYILRMDEYNRHVRELEKQRKEFYEKNPDFPNKNMFMNVIDKPRRIIIEYGI